MRKSNLSFEDLVKENMKELMEDPIALKMIEKRIDERQAKRYVKSANSDDKLTTSNV